MRPGHLDNNNWADLGQLVIDYWKGDTKKADIKKNPKGVLKKYGCKIPKKIAVTAHFDSGKRIHIVIPHCPWSTTGFPNEKNELALVESMEAYRRQLGIVVMGGCR